MFVIGWTQNILDCFGRPYFRGVPTKYIRKHRPTFEQQQQKTNKTYLRKVKFTGSNIVLPIITTAGGCTLNVISKVPSYEKNVIWCMSTYSSTVHIKSPRLSSAGVKLLFYDIKTSIQHEQKLLLIVNILFKRCKEVRPILRNKILT